MSLANMESNNKKAQRKRALFTWLPYLVCVLFLVFLPPVIPKYYLNMLTKVLIFGIFAMGLDLIHGYTGLHTLGQAAYLGVAGYTFGIFMINLGIDSFWILVPLSIAMSGLFACVLGYIALRVRGVYFLLINLALGELLSVTAVKLRTITGGTDGLVGITYPDLGIPGFNLTPFYFYFLVLVLFILSYFILHRIVNSSFGHSIIGIKENETRMRALGYNTWVYKYIAFIIAAIFGGLAGSLYAPFYGAMLPIHLGLMTSATVMLMVSIGTSGTLWGPVLGALIVIFLEHFSSVYTPERWPLILGCVFVIFVLFLRGGVGIYIKRLWRKVVPYSQKY